LVTYTLAAKGDASMIRKHLPFVCPDVDYIEKMLTSPEAIVILAKDRAAVVGVVGGWLEGTPSGYEAEDNTLRQYNAYHEAHLDWIAVAEEYRKKMIGATLVQKVCEWAFKHRKNKIWTEISPKTSIFDIKAFYEKLGFKQIGKFRDEKGEEYVTMLKELETRSHKAST